MTLLQYSWRSPIVDESLIVDDDGRVRLFVLTPGDDAHRDQVGTYQLDPDPCRVERLRAMLSRADGVRASNPSDGVETSAEVEAAERVEAECAGALREEVLGRPYAVLRATSTFTSPVPSLSVTNVIVESLGSSDVIFELDPLSLRLCWPGGAEALASPAIGFLDGEGQLVDGLYTAATLPAGSRAACSLIGALTIPLDVSPDECWVGFGGTLLLRTEGPNSTVDIPVPTDRFLVATRAKG